MWYHLATYIIIVVPPLTAKSFARTTIFRDEQIIFSSNFNITSLLVPADFEKLVRSASLRNPSIFFTISDPTLDGGSCIYVLEDYAAYEVLEGGRDSTSDYGADPNVYFGGKDGIYIYDPDSLSAKKLGPFKDNIIQIQKANGSDTIYFLDVRNKLYRAEDRATSKMQVQNIICATQFVLDTSNNIYFVDCKDGSIHILNSDETNVNNTTLMEPFREIKLLRPAFIMEECIPFFGDGILYILYINGTYQKKDFFLNVKPSAYSVDAGLYLVAALDGKVYEFNVMNYLLTSMFGAGIDWPKDVTKIVMSVINSSIDNSFGFYTGLSEY